MTILIPVKLLFPASKTAVSRAKGGRDLFTLYIPAAPPHCRESNGGRAKEAPAADVDPGTRPHGRCSGSRYGVQADGGTVSKRAGETPTFSVIGGRTGRQGVDRWNEGIKEAVIGQSVGVYAAKYGIGSADEYGDDVGGCSGV